MNAINKNFRLVIANLGPLILLYYLSISEIDTEFSNMFEILSFNIQIIIIYYWMLRDASIIGSGHVFLAGIINDVVTGLPLGLSAISYLTVSLVANYIKNVTVNFSLFTDWFTFLIAIFFSNVVSLTLMLNFSNFTVIYSDIFYNAFFTFLFFPFFWFIFNLYKNLMRIRNDD